MTIFHQHHQSTPSVRLNLQPEKFEVVESKLDDNTEMLLL